MLPVPLQLSSALCRSPLPAVSCCSIRCSAVLPPFFASSLWTVCMCRDTMEMVRCTLLIPSLQNNYSRGGRYDNGEHLVKGPEKAGVNARARWSSPPSKKGCCTSRSGRMLEETVQCEEVKYQCVSLNSARIRLARTCSAGQCLGYRGGRLTDEEVSVAPSLIGVV